jgi:hypothetical protein
MAIVFSSEVNVQPNSFSNFVGQITSDFSKIASGLSNAFTNLTSTGNMPPQPPLEHVYVETGFSSVPGTSFVGSQVSAVSDIKTRQILTQEPNATIYIHKRAFSTLRNENDTRFMNKGEKLFLRATKILFQNKCSQLAAYEAITKASKLLSEDAQLDATRLDAIADYLDSGYQSAVGVINNAFVVQASAELTDEVYKQLNALKDSYAKVVPAIKGVRKAAQNQKKLNSATYTNWVIDPDMADVVNVGRGAGVIELTTVTDINTALKLDGGDLGSVQFSMEDPYNLTKVSSDDLEIALSTAFAEVTTNTVNSDPAAILQAAREQDQQLQTARRNRVAGLFGGTLGGGMLDTSTVSDIIFQINPTAQAVDKVQGTTSSYSEPFNSDNYRLVFNNLPPDQRLTLAEDNLVSSIFGLLTQYVNAMEDLSNATFVQNNDPDTTYARKNLRIHYLGKSIVQPMDGIHVYLRGNTYRNSELMGPLSALLNNSNFVRTFKDDAKDAADAVLEEEMRIFGLSDYNIPVDLYRYMRSGSFMRNAGTHVFGGLVSTVTDTYAPDRGYTMNVAGSSNLKWLNMSRVNTSPGLDQIQGVLEDPITPYDIKVDSATGLPTTNPPLLQENVDRKLVNKTGVNAGQVVEDSNLIQDYSWLLGLPVVQHTPGMVYRWKSGIITSTMTVNLRTALDGSGSASQQLMREVGQTVVENPFASMDAADIISILVTGFPHSYETFIQHTRDTGTYTNGGGTNSPEDYFHTSMDVTRSANRALGNFQPFKTTNLTPEKMAQRIQNQSTINNTSSTLNDLRSKWAQAQDLLDSLNTSVGKLGANKINDKSMLDRVSLVTQLTAQVNSLNAQIQTEVAKFQSNIQAGLSSGLRIYGNDMLVNITEAPTKEESQLNVGKLQIKNSFLQFRPQLKCKFNTDVNLFIVDDCYDKDLDVQAYVLSALKNPDMWKSEYKTPLEICEAVAKTLDLEFFNDSQGHIQLRFPKYNRVPLSLLLKMMLLQQKGTRLYPEFLDALFRNQQKSMAIELESIGLQIQIELILLGWSSDMGAVQSEASYLVVVDEKASISVSSRIPYSVSTITASNLTSNAQNLISARIALAKLSGGNIDDASDQDTINAAIKELQILNDPAVSTNINSARLAEVNKLAGLVSSGQKLNDTLSKIQNKPGNQGGIDGSQLQGNMLKAGSREKILSVFGDLVEDDFNDTLGPGSAARYIINDDQVLSSQFTESDQNVNCRVDVQGSQNWASSGPGFLVPDMPLYWAGATDFDLWRQYGYRPAQTFDRPFLHNAESQCAPYAQMLLTQARKKAVTGTVTLVGNEYYQLGDVVYVNFRDMLYYVTGVSHSFAYAGTFTTTLTLEMGHPLGEYIPTPLDVIGKVLIKGQNQANSFLTNRRTAVNGTVAGVVAWEQKPPTNEVSQDQEDIQSEFLSNSYGSFNLVQLKNALLKINKQPTGYQVQVRGFTDGESLTGDTVRDRMGAVRHWLMSPSMALEDGSLCPLSQPSFPAVSEAMMPAVDPVNISPPVALDDILLLPSEETWNITAGKPTYAIEVVLIPTTAGGK